MCEGEARICTLSRGSCCNEVLRPTGNCILEYAADILATSQFFSFFFLFFFQPDWIYSTRHHARAERASQILKVLVYETNDSACRRMSVVKRAIFSQQFYLPGIARASRALFKMLNG